MLLCFGDVDIMFHFTNVLAIPQDGTPPTRLPPEFNCRVNVYEIFDSEYPGYVFLKRRCLITECAEDGKYYAHVSYPFVGECHSRTSIRVFSEQNCIAI